MQKLNLDPLNSLPLVSGIYSTFSHHIDMSSKRKERSATNYIRNLEKPKLLKLLHYKA